MATKTKAKETASNAYGSARPYVQRLIEDEELRDNLREAYESGRNAYARASGAKKPSALLDDKKLQKELKNASESLRAASDALREPEKRSGGGHPFLKLLFIAFIGGVLAIALSEDLRKAVLDRLFGAEEEFEYSSTTAPPPSSS
jgi:hypothetical protein